MGVRAAQRVGGLSPNRERRRWNHICEINLSSLASCLHHPERSAENPTTYSQAVYGHSSTYLPLHPLLHPSSTILGHRMRRYIRADPQRAAEVARSPVKRRKGTALTHVMVVMDGAESWISRR